MKVVHLHAEVIPELCKGCKTCEQVCPVYAVTVSRNGKAVTVEIDLDRCVGCWNCEQRCPEKAIRMVERETPKKLHTDVSRFDPEDIAALCRKARFHPKQAVCYCTATRAEEVAAAILAGASSPDELVMATGIGAGCGIECNQPVLRFLAAAGRSYERRKSSFQWYGRTVTAWEVPDDIRNTYRVFHFDGDRELFDQIVNAPIRPGAPSPE